jgi:hypothetical protein
MQITPLQMQFKPAQDEVRRMAHDQDLIEIPKRARLDREAEKIEIINKPQGPIEKGFTTGF